MPAAVSEALPDGEGENVLAEEPESAAAVTVGSAAVAVATTVGGNLLAVGLGVAVGAAGVAVPTDVPEALIAEVLVAGESDGRGKLWAHRW